MTTLILGGARSGKSSYAEKLAIESSKELIYIATAKVLDNEMEQRVARHKNDRTESNWTTIEEPIALASALKQWSSPNRVILVDCLTMWLTNLLSENSVSLKKEIDDFLTCINTLSGSIIFVSNEVGLGVVPMGELTRQFVDETGRLHQQLAKSATNVVLMVAGLPLKIKTNGELN